MHNHSEAVKRYKKIKVDSWKKYYANKGDDFQQKN